MYTTVSNPDSDVKTHVRSAILSKDGKILVTSADNGEPQQDNKAEKESEKGDSSAKECDTPKAPEVDKKALKEQFEAYGKFGDKTADGKTIKLSECKMLKVSGFMSCVCHNKSNE